MPSTTNFNWTTPADTDLVKDGAAAIRTLGNGIDASLVDLKGGTTGQVLAKASNTDLDFTWTNGGDITEVAAGTGISGGGTSGNVTITNSMATAIDAKGDLIVGTADNAFSRLASSGVNDQVLTVDTSTSTGLKWAAPAAASGPAFYAFRSSSSQTLTADAWTKIQFQSEAYDTDSRYDPTTNYRFTPNKAGYYQFNVGVRIDTNSTSAVAIGKNGSPDYMMFELNLGAVRAFNGGILLYANGSTDYFEVFSYTSGSPRTVGAGEGNSYFSAVWIRS